MISHETLSKATFAGAVTMLALAVPSFFCADEQKPPVESFAVESYSGPVIQAAPAVTSVSAETKQNTDIEKYRSAVTTTGSRLSAFDPAHHSNVISAKHPLLQKAAPETEPAENGHYGQ